MFIILIGPPGSGKGTQGSLISKKLSLPHLSSGDFFRKISKEISLHGKISFGHSDNSISLDKKDEDLMRESMSKGILFPSDLVNKILRVTILSEEYRNGCILDGYPRNIMQAEYLESFLKKDKKIVFFDLEDEVIIKRISGRIACSNCQKIYNIYYAKPLKEDVCDVCGSISFIRRDDDDLEIIKERIEEYKNETRPLVEYYKKSAEFYSIDANLSMTEITKQLESLLLKKE